MTTTIPQPQRWLRWLPLLGGLALAWQVRDTPWTPLAFVRVDGLSAFFLLLALLALALEPAPLRRPGPALALLLPAFCLTALLPIALVYLGLALLEPGIRQLIAARQGATTRLGELRLAGTRTLEAFAPLLAAACLLLGYGALALQGVASYDQRSAGVALGSLPFWFVLLAALIPLLPLGPAGGGALALAARLAWLYPLLRLYSLGPWNSGWSFAVLLLGGAAALWAAVDALLSPDAGQRTLRARTCLLALGLAAFGLSSSAGLAAGCYCALAALLLQHAEENPAPAPNPSTDTTPTTQHSTLNTQHSPLASPWLLTPAVPLGAPFVAVWLVIGAAVAGGVSALAGVAWLAALLLALAPALHPTPPSGRRAGGLSLALGIGAPLVLLVAVEPLILQLQGGLTPYGDIVIWPWVGLATLDAARTQVATLPSLAVAGLMLVLAALAYLLGRLRAWAPADGPQSPPPTSLLAELRREVPWLGRARPTEEERRVDGE
ncbi:MAG: hypothetical protein OHK0022_16440 [Roseiflexaceae bacterium]